MQTRVTVASTWTDEGVDIVIDADPQAPLAAVLDAARDAAGLLGGAPGVAGTSTTYGAWSDGDLFLPGQRLVFGDGSTLPRQADSDGVSTGAGAGSGWLLASEEAGTVRNTPIPMAGLVVGRGREAGLRVSDPEMSRAHLEFRADANGAWVRDLDSTNGTLLDDELVGAFWTQVDPESTVEAGNTEFRVVHQPGVSARLVLQDLRLEVVESARGLAAADRPLAVNWPTPPATQRRPSIPWVVFLLPLVFAVAVAVWRQQPDLLLFALLTPVSMLGNWWYQRSETRGRSREDLDRYEGNVERARQAVEESTTRELQRLRATHPQPEVVLDTATRRLTALWERRPGHDDFASVRIGTGQRPATARINFPADFPGDQPVLRDAPLTVALNAGTVVGISGQGEPTRGLVRWLVTQLAVQHSPNLLKLAVIGPRLDERQWRAFRWLPHAAQPWLIGTDTGESLAVIDRLTAVPNGLERGDPLLRPAGGERVSAPRAVVFIEDAAELRRLPPVGRLLAEAADLGLAVVCLGDEPRSLPPECRTVIAVSSDTATVTGDVTWPQTRPITVTEGEFDRACRALAPLVAPTVGRHDSGLPDLVRLADLVPGGVEDHERMRTRWQRRSIAGPVGMTEQGAFVLDLPSQGPHALVAGAPGSGKSEFLRTAVTSMAATASPEQVSFVFIDYKGDSAFRVLKDLPHCSGFVTDLDSQGAERALESFKAEVRRRSRLITVDAQADDIADYAEIRRRHPERGLPPLPRLVILVDEFARLKQSMPDFITGLVEIAQVGRSLGMHLVLATQRPAGNISDQIRACVDLVICLRTASETESRDVIGTSDAATLPKAARGRALVRIGGGPVTTLQTASSTWAGGDTSRDHLTVRRLAWHESPAHALQAAPDDTTLGTAVRAHADENPEVEATAVVRTARALWRGHPPVHRVWLEPLPEVLPIATLDAVDGVTLRIGLMDRPEEQTQAPLFWPLDNGHLAVVGGLRTGRTTALRTWAADLADRTAVADLHLHVIDGGGGLASLRELPHAGTVVGRGDVERVKRLLDAVDNEISLRRARYLAANAGSLTEQRAAGLASDPYVLLLVDRWDAFLDADPQAELTPRLSRVLSDGPEVGVFAVIAGDERFGTTTAIAQRMSGVLALSVSDPTAAIVPGLTSRQLLVASPPGRAVWAATGNQVQIPVLGAAANTPAQNSVLAEIAANATARTDYTAPHPVRIDALPVKLDLEQASTLPSMGMGPILCVGGNTLTAIRLDLDEEDRVVHLVGRVGEATAAASMIATQVLAAGRPVRWLGPGAPAAVELLPSADALATVDVSPPGLVVITSFTGLAPDSLSRLVGSSGPAILLVTGHGQMTPAPLVPVLPRVRTSVYCAPLTRYDLPAHLASGVEPGFRLDGPPGRALLFIDANPAVVQLPTAE